VPLLKAGDGVLNPKIWNTWADTDPRKEGSILQVGKIEQGTADYKATRFHETGYWNKTQLYNTVLQQETKVCLYKCTTTMQISTNACIRFYLYADVLLMHSEISG
jgi:hypothetical protein